METKKAYIEKLAARLKAWDARMDELKARADESKADAKIAYHKQIAELKDRREEAVRHLAELHEAGEDKWLEVRAKAERLAEDVKKAIKRAA